MNLFALLSGGLGAEERLRFDLSREDDRLVVLVQPILKAAPPGLDDERQRLRVALAHPLWLTGTPEQLDRELATALAEYGAKRRDLCAVVADLDALDEGLRQARQATQRQRAAQAEKKAAPVGAKPVPHNTDGKVTNALPGNPVAVAAAPARPLTGGPGSLF
jgi:PRTRC genetic system protein E